MDLHYKKDGTLDMRYTSSREAMASGYGASSFGGYGGDYGHSSNSRSSDLHYKKDGTLDMRYNSSKMASQSNKNEGHGSRNGIPIGIPVTKTGCPDMRTKEARNWVQQQAKLPHSDLPSWIPRKKDSTPDHSKAATREFMNANSISSIIRSFCLREEYYANLIRNTTFLQLVSDQRRQPIEYPSYQTLPNQESLSTHFRRQRNTGSSSQCDDDNIFDDIATTATLMNYSDLKIDRSKELGRGAFGIVYSGTWKGRQVAVKELFLKQLARREKKSFVNEIKIMSAVGMHRNLVYLHGYVSDPLCIVMEYVELGSLSYILHYAEDPKIEAKIVDGRVKQKLILGIINGMTVLHTVGVVHGDLKPQNVLVSGEYIAKVSDFGLSTLRGKTSSTIASSVTSDSENAIGGTAGYMAPELLQNSKPPEYSCDVYSFGIMLNEVICEEEPYSDQYANFQGRGPFGVVNYAKNGNRPRIHPKMPLKLKACIDNCWHREHLRRPTFEELWKDLQPSIIKFPNSFGTD